MADAGRPSYVFLSYSNEDKGLVSLLERQLSKYVSEVWRDTSIPGGTRWQDEIERKIRGARAVVVLLTPSSAKSQWVIHEYAFSTGANVPIVTVAVPGVDIPRPLAPFHVVTFSTAEDVAKKVYDGILAQERSARERTTLPTMVAKFMEHGGRPIRYFGGKTYIWRIELWLAQVPAETRSVKFEILDHEIQDRQWDVHRKVGAGSEIRQFLTGDIELNRSVEILALGTGAGAGSWSATSTFSAALNRYYQGRNRNADIDLGLKQFEAT
jgi:TIR domain-containing protein